MRKNIYKMIGVGAALVMTVAIVTGCSCSATTENAKKTDASNTTSNVVKADNGQTAEVNESSVANFAKELVPYGVANVGGESKIDLTGDKLDDYNKAIITAYAVGELDANIDNVTGDIYIPMTSYKEYSTKYFGKEITFTDEYIKKSDSMPISAVSSDKLTYSTVAHPSADVKGIISVLDKQSDGSYAVKIVLKENNTELGYMELTIKPDTSSQAGMILTGMTIVSQVEHDA